MAQELLFGITQKNTAHRPVDPPISIDEMFRRAKDIFDYFDKTPPAGEVEEYEAASEKYGLPILAGGWFYTLGRDEPLLEANLRLAQRLGSRVHNVQVMAAGHSGLPVTNEQVLEAYLRAYDIGRPLGVTPCFEVHVNMWSEDFRRVAEVAQAVEKFGVPYCMTLDHSHIIFKIDNPPEWDEFSVKDAARRAEYSIRADVEGGRLVLDPSRPGNVCDQWIGAGYVRHMHARAAVPNGPVNAWAKHPDGKPGRGIQYPFIEPGPGEWHSEWDGALLEPWKEVVRQTLRHHARHEASRMQISTEFIPNTDYGEGAKYSLLDNGIACARWMREVWADTLAEAT